MTSEGIPDVRVEIKSIGWSCNEITNEDGYYSVDENCIPLKKHLQGVDLKENVEIDFSISFDLRGYEPKNLPKLKWKLYSETTFTPDEIYLIAIDETLKSGQIFFGKEQQKFEKRFIKENNLKYGVAVGSGTDALYIALLGLGIKQDDEIITVSNTAIPTISAIGSSGAKARFVDIGPDYLINTDNIEKYISSPRKEKCSLKLSATIEPLLI